MSINRDEWLRALAAAEQRTDHDERALTVTEFATLMQLPRTTAGEKLRRMVAAGHAQETRKWVLGRSRLAFRLVEKKRKTKAA